MTTEELSLLVSALIPFFLLGMPLALLFLVLWVIGHMKSKRKKKYIESIELLDEIVEPIQTVLETIEGE